jgi:hypothetical protein
MSNRQTHPGQPELEPQPAAPVVAYMGAFPQLFGLPVSSQLYTLTCGRCVQVREATAQRLCLASS